jgi:hypothetical protein
MGSEPGGDPNWVCCCVFKKEYPPWPARLRFKTALPGGKPFLNFEWLTSAIKTANAFVRQMV